jgi:hypothetical protein
MQHHFPFTTAWKYNVWHCNFSHWNKQSTQTWDSCIQRRRAMLAPVLFAPPPSRAATLGVLSCTSCINFNRKAHILSLLLQSYYLVIGRQTQPHLLEMAAKRYIKKCKCVEMKYTSSNCNSVTLYQTHRESERGTEETHGTSYPGSWQSCIHMSHPHCIATYPYIQLPHQTKNILFSNTTTQLLSSL